ncbi:MAG: tetratricopeptide repeat protein [Caulobacter sp.]|nr:tetratricopeptide repeat protein [Caulobacter sp.]
MPGLTRWLAAAVAALGLLLMLPTAAQAKWLRAETPRFIVYSDGSEVTLRDQITKLEAFDTILRQFHGLPAEGVPPRKMEIYLVDGPTGLRRVWPGAEGIAGFYSADEDGVFSVAVRQRKEDRTLFHEYTHHFMLQFFPYPYPAWLIEGYAEYFGATQFNGKFIEVGRFDEGRTNNLIYLGWVSLDDLLTKRPFQLGDGDSAALFYAQAWLLTHYFMGDAQRYPRMLAYMKEVGSGENSAEAMVRAAGMPLPDLDRTLRSYLKGGLPYGRYPMSPPPAVAVSVLPPSADDTLLLSLRLIQGARPSDELMADIRKVVAKWPGDRSAILLLANALTRSGDPAAAEQSLRDLLAVNPNDVDVLIALGNNRLAAARDVPDRRTALHREAGKLFARAYKLDAASYKALYGYVRSRTVESGYPNDNDMEALLAANELAPQADDITLAAAYASILRREWPRARALLLPLANSPHGGDAAREARDMLKRVDAASPAPAPA